MRRIAFACVALVSTGCAGILGLDDFTEGESSGPGAGGGTPTSSSTGDPSTSTGDPSTSTSTGDGGSGAGTGDGGSGAGVPDPLDVSPEGTIKVGILRSLQFESNVPTTWSVDEPDGGTIDENGFYIAPDEPGTFHVTATSVGNPEDTVTVTITAAPLGVRVVGGIPGGAGTIDGPVARARLNTPGGMGMVSNGDRMVIADTNSHTIRLWNRQQDTVSTIAGAPFQAGFADGPGVDARFNRPTRVVGVQNSSTAYVVDHDNHCVRQINTATGVVSTLAGRCGTSGSADANVGTDVTFDDITAMVMAPSATRLFVCQEGGNAPLIRQIEIATGATATIPVAVTGSLGGGCRLATDFWRDLVYFTAYGIDDVRSMNEAALGTLPTVVHVVDRPQNVAIDDLATMTGYGNSDDIYLSSQGALYHYRIGQPAFDAAPYLGPDRDYVDGPLADARMTSARVMFAYPQQSSLFFADGQGRTIRRIYDSQQEVSTVVGVPANLRAIDGPKSVARLPFPFTIALDEDGNVFTSGLGDGEGDSQTIRRVDAVTGAISTFTGAEFQGQIVDGPADVATFSVVFDAVRLGDALYVLDFLTHGVRRVELSDGSVSTIAGRVGEPGFSDGIGAQAQFDFEGAGGIATDGAFLYVADGGNFAIRRIDPATGEVTTLAGGTQGTSNGVGEAAQFLAPWGVTHDRGVLYVTDAEDQVIRRLDLETLEVTSVIGLSGVAGSQDGDASEATFSNPVRIAADGIGNLYVTSFPEENSETYLGTVIRRIDLEDLTVSTHAGDRSQLGFAAGPLPSTLGCPLSAVVDAAGDLVFADRCDGVIGAIRPL